MTLETNSNTANRLTLASSNHCSPVYTQVEETKGRLCGRVVKGALAMTPALIVAAVVVAGIGLMIASIVLGPTTGVGIGLGVAAGVCILAGVPITIGLTLIAVKIILKDRERAKEIEELSNYNSGKE